MLDWLDCPHPSEEPPQDCLSTSDDPRDDDPRDEGWYEEWDGA